MLISVVYHSQYGHTAKQAESVAEGAKSFAGAEVKLFAVDKDEMQWDILKQSDAIIFGCPTYMGNISAGFKKFMEETSNPVWIQQQWKNKFAAGFTNSASQSGDKLNTLTSLAVFAAQHGMLWVSLGLLPGNNASTASVEDLNRLGSFLGAMSQSNADQGPDVAPSKSDLATAFHLGHRVAEQAARLKP